MAGTGGRKSIRVRLFSVTTPLSAALQKKIPIRNLFTGPSAALAVSARVETVECALMMGVSSRLHTVLSICGRCAPDANSKAI